MKDIVIEKAKRHYKCPFCNNEVLTVHLGEVFGKMQTLL